MSERSNCQPAGVAGGARSARAAWREAGRDLALQNALRKRAAGVPTYSVPEAAALLSVSQEHLYRLVRADAFPAVRMRAGGGDQGRYVVPAKAVERLLDAAAGSGACVEVGDWAPTWQTPTDPATGAASVVGPRGGDAA
ncbi:helix-turn-helix domain-containing protein [Actinopolymorpha rutila]|uniref:Excisionase family DNA binding protein n=1 Tax=Actinopolymorpha rutila TaxID=446787 RepID=A0A852Z944_9ACTN|nr:helix-turn-helix domain-containing protein [Actinopolymorpha rutila]NYH88228.1 excisionase family DNA binding protein [Actinopolymorpha rutila]